MNETMKIIFGLVGGLAIFIYGMNMMSECLQKAAGEKNEENPCPAYKKSDSWCTCRCFDDSGVTEQQRNNGYDNRLCQCRTDVAATGDLYYSRCQYRYDHDGTDYCI